MSKEPFLLSTYLPCHTIPVPRPSLHLPNSSDIIVSFICIAQSYYGNIVYIQIVTIQIVLIQIVTTVFFMAYYNSLSLE